MREPGRKGCAGRALKKTAAQLYQGVGGSAMRYSALLCRVTGYVRPGSGHAANRVRWFVPAGGIERAVVASPRKSRTFHQQHRSL